MASITITANGRPETVGAGMSILTYLASHGLTPERSAVELNMNVVKRQDHATTVLHEGDQIEIVSFVGGG